MHIWRLILVVAIMTVAGPVPLLAQEQESLTDILERQEGLLEARQAKWDGEILDPRQVALVTATLLIFDSAESATASYPALVEDFVTPYESVAGFALEPIEVDGDLDVYLARETNEQAEREHIAIFMQVGPYVAELFISSSAMLDPALPDNRRDLLLNEGLAAADEWVNTLASTQFPVTGSDAWEYFPPAGSHPLSSVSREWYEREVLFEAPAVQLPMSDEQGLIAFISLEGSLQVMRPDGTQRRVVLSNGAVSHFRDPVWSHDGTMLASREIAFGNVTSAIWVYRDGFATQLPNTAGCHAPVFSGDNQRVVYSCWDLGVFWDPATAQTSPEPQSAFLVSSALDGSDQRVELANPPGVDLPGEVAFRGLDVNPIDNTYLVMVEAVPVLSQNANLTTFDSSATTWPVTILSSEFDVLSKFAIGPEAQAQGYVSILPGLEGVVAYACLQDCARDYWSSERLEYSFVLLDRETGQVLDDEAIQYPDPSAPYGLDVSPDQSAVIYGMYFGFDAEIMVNRNDTGWEWLAEGYDVTWQPVPSEILVIDPEDVYNVIPDEFQPVDEVSGDVSADEPDLLHPPTVPPPPAMEVPKGQVAFVGADGNIRVIGSDGSGEQQVTFDAGEEYRYASPSWSSTGSMLTFVRVADDGSSLGILVLENGVVSLIPETEGCTLPTFDKSAAQLYYSCWRDTGVPPDPTDPRTAMLVSSYLSGYNQQVVVASPSVYVDPGLTGLDPVGVLGVSAVAIDIDRDSGDILIVTAYRIAPDTNSDAEYDLHTQVEVLDSSFQIISSFSLDGEMDMLEFGPTDAWFAERSGEIIANACIEACDVVTQTGAFSLVTVDYDGSMGSIWTNLHVHDSADGGDIVDMEFAWVREHNFNIEIVLPDETQIILADGTQPVWTSGGNLVNVPLPGAQIVTLPTEPAVVVDASIATEPVDEMPTTDTVAVSEAGWIAYTGEDGNIWVMRSDGSNATQITTAISTLTYENPTWSHDGTMLAFEWNDGNTLSLGITVYRDGETSVLTDTAGCRLPAFSADNTRIFYSCWGMDAREYPIPANTVEPQKGFLSSSALDGSDPINHLGYPTVYTDGSNGYGVLRGIDVRPGDGALLLFTENESVDGDIWFTADLYDASVTPTTSIVLGDATGTDPAGPFAVAFGADNTSLATMACVSGCTGHPGGIALFGILDIESQVFNGWEVYLALETIVSSAEPSPDSEHWVAEIERTSSELADIALLGPDAFWSYIGVGSDPAWQPVPVQVTMG